MPYLPLIVRLSIVFDDQERSPDLDVAMRLSTSVAELRQSGSRF